MDVWITYPYYGYGLDNWYLIARRRWGNEYYSLTKFDVNALPANVSSAQVKLFCFRYPGDVCPNTSDLTVSMYLDRVDSACDETTKWSSKPSFTYLRTIPVPSVCEWYVIDITDLYNGWKTGSYENYGIQLTAHFH